MYLLLMGIGVKVIIFVLSVKLLKNFYRGYLLYSFSWLFSYILMLSGMIFLSFFNILTGRYLIIYLLMVIFGLIIANKYSKKKFCDLALAEYVNSKNKFENNGINILNILAIIAFIVLIITLVMHNLLYYDTTDDALTQGMTKLAFIQQHASLFVNYDTWTINIFSNEWFGEMNGLFYLLVSQKDKMVLLGNVEIYLFIYITLVGVIRTLKYNGDKIYVLAGYFSTIPVILGLAMTVKTDLVSLIMALLLTIVLWEYFKCQDNFLLIVGISLVGGTAASKITLIPLAGLLGISLIFYYFINVKNKKVFPVVGGIAIALIFTIRYVINLVQYHNPIQRALNEKIAFSLENVFGNLAGIFRSFMESIELVKTIKPRSSNNWVLNKGMGYGGELVLLLVLVSFIYYLLKKKNKEISHLKYIVLPHLGAFIYALFSMVWYEWSFRYFFSYILCIEVLAILFLINDLSTQKRILKKTLSLIYIFLFMCMCTNSLQAFRIGQAIPVPANELKNMPKTQQKLLYSSCAKYDDLKAVDGLSKIFEEGGTGVVLDEFSVPFYHFFGDDNCVKIDLVKEQEQILNNFLAYDFIAIASKNYDEALYDELESQLSEHGYKKYVGSYGAVFMP